MYQIVMIPNNSEANLSLTFKLKETADAAFTSIKASPGIVELTDDFGYMVCMKVEFLSYILFVDVEKSQEVQFEKDIAINRARFRIQESLEAQGFAPMKEKKPSIIKPN